MSRLRLLVLGLLAAAVLVLVAKPSSSSGYRVDAIFDTADAIASGMQVKVAGVPVGSVIGVKLTPGLKARIELQVSRRFTPFHADARCQILPEGIISENYVECDPGSPSAPALIAASGATPTVPLAHDSTPVSLQQFIDIFNLPVADRLRILLNELGIATAGRGQDINAILRRANPALTQADRVLATIDAQRAQLADAVGQTDQVVSQLAARSGSVRQFVDRAAAVTGTTAAHRGQLATAIDRLPALLIQVKHATGALHQFTVSGIPLLNALRAGAPALTRLTTTLPTFTTAALPAVHQLASVAAEGRRALTAASPLLTELRNFATDATPTAQLLNQLLVNLRNRGGIEYLQDYIYAITAAFAPFDTISHFALINLIVTPCIANPLAAGCNRGWGTVASRQQAAAGKPTPAIRTPVRQRASHGAQPHATPQPSQISQPSSSSSPTDGNSGNGISPPPSQPPSSVSSTLSGLLNYLLK